MIFETRSAKEQLLSAQVKVTLATMKEESAVRRCDGSDEAIARFNAAERDRKQAEAERAVLLKRLHQSDE